MMEDEAAQRDHEKGCDDAESGVNEGRGLGPEAEHVEGEGGGDVRQTRWRKTVED